MADIISSYNLPAYSYAYALAVIAGKTESEATEYAHAMEERGEPWNVVYIDRNGTPVTYDDVYFISPALACQLLATVVAIHVIKVYGG